LLDARAGRRMNPEPTPGETRDLRALLERGAAAGFGPAPGADALQPLARKPAPVPAVRVRLRDVEEPGSAVNAPATPERRVAPRGRATYQVVGEIGRGAMGVVMKALDLDLGRDVAIKVLSPELAK